MPVATRKTLCKTSGLRDLKPSGCQLPPVKRCAKPMVCGTLSRRELPVAPLNTGMVRISGSLNLPGTSARTHWNGVGRPSNVPGNQCPATLEWWEPTVKRPLIQLRFLSYCVLSTTLPRGGLWVETWGILVSSKGESPTCELVSLPGGKLELMPCEYR